MKIIKTALNGICIIKADVFSDERGYFLESYHKEKLKNFGIEAEFYQDNFSLSAKNVLRGLHFQNPPFDQGKLIKVISGVVLDVVVDIRKDSEAGIIYNDPTLNINWSVNQPVLSEKDRILPKFSNATILF